MSTYTTLDAAIVASIAKPTAYSPMWDRSVREKASFIATEAGRTVERVIDGRLQALRRAGVIAYLTKTRSPTGRAKWAVLPEVRL